MALGPGWSTFGVGRGTCGISRRGREADIALPAHATKLNLTGKGVEVPTMELSLVEASVLGSALHFNFLVVDCEGCGCAFLEEYHTTLLAQVRGLILELDMPELCDYAIWQQRLTAGGLQVVHHLPGGHTVFMRPD